MVNEIILNDVHLHISDFQQNAVKAPNGMDLHQVSFTFPVKSEEYHDIAVLLYERTFDVTVPSNALRFKGTITNYATSITNLYKENAVGKYTLELTEILSEEIRA